MMMTYVHNLPANVNKYRYIVARAVDGDMWFFSAWDAKHAEQAHEQAIEYGGFVLENPHEDEF